MTNFGLVSAISFLQHPVTSSNCTAHLYLLFTILTISICCRPANGAFTVELAMNRAFTSLSFNGEFVATFGDGKDHPGLGNPPPNGGVPPCITEPNSKGYASRCSYSAVDRRVFLVHTQNESMAAGTAFAISYQVCRNTEI